LATRPIPPLGWGRVGHELVGALAQALLNSNANEMCQNLLPLEGGSLEAVAPWADDVRRLPEYAWSAPLHFINTPAWKCDYVRSRDCTSESGEDMMCVDGAIQNYTSRVNDTSIGSDQQAEALKFLVHFVGDIHQPLHCGFTEDEGGNLILGYFLTRQANLHQIWDTMMIVKRIKDDFGDDQDAFESYLLGKIHGDWAAEAKAWVQCSSSAPYDACSAEWGQDSVLDACKYSYVESDGTTRIDEGFLLEEDYYYRNMPLIEKLLAKAAVRLGHVLNVVWPGQNATIAA